MSLEVGSLRALAHPVRLQMLSLLTGAAMSAAEVARELDISQANASYHLRVLAKAGEIVEVGEEKIRGGVAKRYKYDVDRPPPPRRRDGAGAGQAFHQAIAAELVRRSRVADPQGRADLTDAELWVPPDVWGQVVELVHEASSLLHREAQPPRSEGTVRVNMTAVLFQMTEAADDVVSTSSTTGGRARQHRDRP